MGIPVSMYLLYSVLETDNVLHTVESPNNGHIRRQKLPFIRDMQIIYYSFTISVTRGYFIIAFTHFSLA